MADTAASLTQYKAGNVNIDVASETKTNLIILSFEKKKKKNKWKNNPK